MILSVPYNRIFTTASCNLERNTCTVYHDIHAWWGVRAPRQRICGLGAMIGKGKPKDSPFITKGYVYLGNPNGSRSRFSTTIIQITPMDTFYVLCIQFVFQSPFVTYTEEHNPWVYMQTGQSTDHLYRRSFS